MALEQQNSCQPPTRKNPLRHQPINTSPAHLYLCLPAQQESQVMLYERQAICYHFKVFCQWTGAGANSELFVFFLFSSTHVQMHTSHKLEKGLERGARERAAIKSDDRKKNTTRSSTHKINKIDSNFIFRAFSLCPRLIKLGCSIERQFGISRWLRYTPSINLFHVPIPVKPSSHLDYVINALSKLSPSPIRFDSFSLSLALVFPIELNCYWCQTLPLERFLEHLIGAELVEVKYDRVIFHSPQCPLPSSLYLFRFLFGRK